MDTWCIGNLINGTIPIERLCKGFQYVHVNISLAVQWIRLCRFSEHKCFGPILKLPLWTISYSVSYLNFFIKYLIQDRKWVWNWFPVKNWSAWIPYFAYFSHEMPHAEESAKIKSRKKWIAWNFISTDMIQQLAYLPHSLMNCQKLNFD